jgi:hypothetical protein
VRKRLFSKAFAGFCFSAAATVRVPTAPHGAVEGRAGEPNQLTQVCQLPILRTEGDALPLPAAMGSHLTGRIRDRPSAHYEDSELQRSDVMRNPILLIVLVILALAIFGGGFGGYYPRNYGFGGGGLLLVIILVLLFL